MEIESDSMMLIHIINKECATDAILECFLYDIGLLLSQLGRVKFMFVKQDGNAAAHSLASYVASHGCVFRCGALGLKFLFDV